MWFPQLPGWGLDERMQEGRAAYFDHDKAGTGIVGPGIVDARLVVGDVESLDGGVGYASGC